MPTSRRVAALLVVLVVVGAACGRGSTPTRQAAPNRGAAVVSKHVDGDTIRITIDGREEKVRLIGIDTPETRGRGGLRECFGREASEHLAKLLPLGTAVRLERDAEARDRYGRLLAYIYRVRDDLFVNLALAREGFAAVLTYPPNVAHASEFVAAAADARARNVGLWSKCGSADVPIP